MILYFIIKWNFILLMFKMCFSFKAVTHLTEHVPKQITLLLLIELALVRLSLVIWAGREKVLPEES